MDCIAHRVTKSRTRLSDFHLTHLNKKQRKNLTVVRFSPGTSYSMADHKHIYPNVITHIEMSQVGGAYQQCRRHETRFHPWVEKIPWRRAWQPTPVFLPGESLGQRSLEGYSPWGCKQSDTTEVT